MANIVQLQLRGFQSHVDTTVSLVPGLNVITGPSDSGKTAIIRAVRWVAFNEPAGEAFIHPAVGKAEVTLTLDNGTSITKRRQSRRTIYILNEPNREPQTFEKAEVPDEVTSALGIREYTFGDFAAVLNIAYQLEAPFLISEPASAGAKVLGKLAGTEVVDLAIKSAGSQYRAASSDRQQATKERDQLNVELLDYTRLDEIKTFQQSAERLFQETAALNIRRDKLTALAEDYDRATLDAKRATQSVIRLADVPELVERCAEIESVHQRLQALQSYWVQWQRAKQVLDQTTQTIEKLTQLPEAEYLLAETQIKNQQLSQLKALWDKYDAAKNTYDNYSARLKEADKEEQSTRQELEALWASLDVCPLCELPIKEDRHGHSRQT